MFVDTGINLDLPARASQKPRLPKRAQILALIRMHVAQRTEGQEYPGERAEPGAGRHTGFQRLDKETRQMFESLRLRGMQSDTFILPIWIALLVHGRV